jgi:hypothetical protein
MAIDHHHHDPAPVFDLYARAQIKCSASFASNTNYQGVNTP